MNPTTGKAYRGGNVIHLFAVAMSRGYDDPRWMTYRQAQEHDWQVRKGEKGTQIEFWDVKRITIGEPETGAPDEEETPERRSRLIHRVYTVFNASQIDGVPAHRVKERTPFEVQTPARRSWPAPVQPSITTSSTGLSTTEAKTVSTSRSRDFFPDAAGYYGTALHELAHWTGHPSRLDRPTLNESYTFGDPTYAQEELRAELASVFLAAERGIPHQPERHAAYVANWIRALRNDKNEIFRAAADAAKATDYLLESRAKTAGRAPTWGTP